MRNKKVFKCIMAVMIMTCISACGRAEKEPDDAGSYGTEGAAVSDTAHAAVEEPQEEKIHQDTPGVISIRKSADVQSEADIVRMMNDRGFSECRITAPYDMNGNLREETQIMNDPGVKSPVYQTYYMNESGNPWTIMIINGKIFAYPASHSTGSGLQKDVVVSETNEITSYDRTGNTFSVISPKDAEVIMIKVDRVDKKTLDHLTPDRIDNQVGHM